MILRKFVISIVSKYTGDGFAKADKDITGLRKAAKRAESELKKLDRAQTKASNSAAKLASAERKAEAQTRKTGDAAGKAGNKINQAGNKAGKGSSGFKKVADSMGQLGPLAGSVATAVAAIGTAAIAVGGGVIKVGADFESLRAQLNNLLGGTKAGEEAFARIQQFTSSTPFQLEEVTTGFIKLENQGLTPTEERMTALGDIAAANNKSFDQIVEAALDAAMGENERLKEFGIKASSAGDKVSFAFRGQTIEVEKSKEAIIGALVQMGQMEGVAGSMGAQMGTTKGIISNLKDSIALFFDQVARMGVLDEFKMLLKDIGAVAGDGDGLAGTLANALVRILKSLREAIQSVTQQQVEQFFHGILEVAKAVASVIEVVVSAFQGLIATTGGLEQAMIALSLGIIAVQAAFMGPAGLVVAAAAAGAALGLVANELFNADDRLEALLEKVTGMDKFLTELEGRHGGMTGKRGAPELAGGPIDTSVETVDLAGAAAEAARKRAEEMGIGEREYARLREAGFGENAAKQLASDKVEYFAALERERVLEATGGVRMASVEGAAELAIGSENESVRRAAEFALGLDELQSTAETKLEGERAAAEGKKKKGGKGKKGKTDPFDFRAKAEKAAQQQAVEFADRELERLVAMGVESSEAIKQAAEAGKEKQKELTQRFLEAGKIFEADTNNILDQLGLKGPGSVLEGRPPPASLVISISPTFVMFQNFTQQIGEVTGAKALEEITGQAGEAAVAQGMDEYMARVEQMITASINLQGNRLLKADGGGRLPPGPDG